MRVSLVVPNVVRHLHEETFEPLGVLYLAAAIRDRHEVDIVDAFNANLGLDETFEQVNGFAPDLVGLSITMSPSAPFARELAHRIKASNQAVTIVVGGTHATFSSATLAANPDVDFVVLNEGERTFRELLTSLELRTGVENVSGIAFARGGKVIHTAERELLHDLDALPFPARDLLPHDMTYRRRQILSSRGCVYRCIYCAASAMNRHRWRSRSAANVLAEVENLVSEYGSRFYFADDNFTVNPRRVIEICDGMRERKLEVNWSCLSRLEFVRDERLLAIMACSGCKDIFIGVESGSTSVLKSLQRNYSAKDVLQTVRACRRAGMSVTVSFIIGNPFEKEEDVRRTFGVAQALDTPNVAFHIFTPYVGTEAYEFPERFDLRILSDDPEAFDKNLEAVVETAYLSTQQIMDLYYESFGLSLRKAREGLWQDV